MKLLPWSRKWMYLSTLKDPYFYILLPVNPNQHNPTLFPHNHPDFYIIIHWFIFCNFIQIGSCTRNSFFLVPFSHCNYFDTDPILSHVSVVHFHIATICLAINLLTAIQFLLSFWLFANKADKNIHISLCMDICFHLSWVKYLCLE